MKSSKLHAPSSSEAPGIKIQEEAIWSSAALPEFGGFLLKEEGNGNTQAHPFDLEERTARFGEEIVRFSKLIPQGPANNRLIDQVVGAGTSVGANYCEANECVSRKDFLYSISRCKKEAKETRHFVRMIAASEPQLTKEARSLYREATELLLIFSKMYRK
jgi:four helix bundle protein